LKEEFLGYAVINPPTNIIYISHPFNRLVLSVNTTSKSVDGKIEVHGADK